MSAPAKIERKGYLAIQMLQDSILLALLATVTTVADLTAAWGVLEVGAPSQEEPA